MARVKLTFPNQNPIFYLQIPVRITDLNYGNHLGNDSLLSILHETRAAWLRNIGLTELNIGDCGLIMADVMIAYKNESYYGDILDITIFVAEINPKSFDLYYRVKTIRNENQELLIAEAKTGMVCYDYGFSKICTIPSSFLQVITNRNL